METWSLDDADVEADATERRGGAAYGVFMGFEAEVCDGEEDVWAAAGAEPGARNIAERFDRGT